jgi:branched-chain amino acid transport system substrate-binding protein
MATSIARRTFLKLAGGTAAATWLPRGAAAQSPIRIGFTLSATGPYAVGAGITQRPNYDLWLDQVNAKGGLAVAGGGRRPVQFVEHDDRSEIETIATRSTCCCRRGGRRRTSPWRPWPARPATR